EIGETLAFLKQPEPPCGWREALEMLPLLKTVMAMRPRTVTSGACQEIVLRGAEIDLSLLPIQTCWPDEPAPLITWPLVVTKGPSDAREDGFNLGIYRMQVTGRDTTLMRWLRHRGGAQHHQRWRAAKREPLPAPSSLRGPRCRIPCPNTNSQGCCVASGWISSTARPCRSKCRPRPRSSSRATSRSTNMVTKAPTAITPAITTRSNNSQFSAF